MKKLFISLAVAVFSFLTISSVAIHSQTVAVTDLTNPQTDFGRDVKNGIDSTKNDPIAQKQQKDDKDNEVDGAKEQTENVEVKEAQEVSEVPEGVDAKNVDSEGATKDKANDNSGGKEGKTSTSSNKPAN